ncbi:MAG: hypothetical protein IT364_09485 [Candidatus Hydrogenedentes bacterium]|nr:hypothetical protein [Candidatus Hydrogenedentota bacterium]
MKQALMIISILALVVLLVAPTAVFLQKMELSTCKHWMFAATVIWFVTAPFWMKRKAQ